MTETITGIIGGLIVTLIAAVLGWIIPQNLIALEYGLLALGFLALWLVV